MSKLVFCYWDLRGLAAPAVNMLEYGGVQYEHKLVTNRDDWLEEKFKLGLDFPNLPYIIDGDVRLTESWAIYKYVARKVGLVPSQGEASERQSDMLQGVINDIRYNFAMHCYNPEFYNLTDKLLATQKQKIDMLEKYLESRDFLMDNKPTYLDFALYETLDHHRLFFEDIFSKFPNVESYLKRFESIDRLDAYFKSGRYHQFPINGPMATWGGQAFNDKK